MKLLIVQPHLTAYRLPFFEDLATKIALSVAYSPQKSGDGFGSDLSVSERIGAFPVSTRSYAGGRFFYQTSLIRLIVREKPDAIFTFANTRYISFWFLLLWTTLFRIPFFAHGQGFMRHPHPGMIRSLLFRLIISMSTRYIAYNKAAARSLDLLGLSEKIAVLENYVANPETVVPEGRDFTQQGILYIGRLRADCNLDLLVEAIDRINQTSSKAPLTVSVVGGGALLAFYQGKYFANQNVRFFGELYDPVAIRDAAKDCFLGCYPGAAGLSVIHMMSLSLPPVVHDRFDLHMGPEPAYITDRENGFLYSLSDPGRSLEATLKRLTDDRDAIAHVAARGFEFYTQLTNISMADRLLEIINS